MFYTVPEQAPTANGSAFQAYGSPATCVGGWEGRMFSLGASVPKNPSGCPAEAPESLVPLLAPLLVPLLAPLAPPPAPTVVGETLRLEGVA